MQTLGIIDASWGETPIPCEKGSKLKLGGLKNNPVIMGRQVHRAQEMEASEITLTTNLMRGQKLKDLLTGGEKPLTVRCDTGQTYVFPDAFLTNRPEMTSGEGGKIELTFAAGEPEELLHG
ncbi:hypothetical protein GXW74_15555 [Roseomonas eburnea]|uniref:Phage tail protein n=1 Tax=Neoroseomonas eburnea TaxID=1346889 RepID=A0A9X9XDX4_9PROT|nr:phage tail tube protein [Neoroseomonas eburnea]MBR0681910.1 hypothetical protein [Neoroseomonas eburnea]